MNHSQYGSKLVKPGKKIEELRIKHGMSQSDLARSIGTSQNTVSKIESGVTLRSGYFPAIAKVFKITTEELLSEHQPEEVDVDPYKAKLIRRIEEAPQEDLDEIEQAINAVLKLAELKRQTR